MRIENILEQKELNREWTPMNAKREAMICYLFAFISVHSRLLSGQVNRLVQNSTLPGVRANGITSRMFDTPVKNISSLSNPKPKPACGTVP